MVGLSHASDDILNNGPLIISVVQDASLETSLSSNFNSCFRCDTVVLCTIVALTGYGKLTFVSVEEA